MNPAPPGTNETWGIGTENPALAPKRNDRGDRALRRGSGWTIAQRLDEGSLTGFEFQSSPLAGQMIPHGDGVLAGTLPRKAAARGRPSSCVRGRRLRNRSGRHGRKRNATARRRTAAAQRRNAVRRQARAADRAPGRSRRRSRRAAGAGHGKVPGSRTRSCTSMGTSGRPSRSRYPRPAKKNFACWGSPPRPRRLAAGPALL